MSNLQISNILRMVTSAGRESVLCTVLERTGSAPREPGAAMLVFQDGTTTGTIGGGELERYAIRRAAGLCREGRSEIEPVRLRQEDPLGMACGGEVTLAYQYFDPQNAAVPVLTEQVHDRICRRISGYIAVSFQEGSWMAQIWEELPPALACSDGQPRFFPDAPTPLWIQPIPLPSRTLLFGAGHVGRALLPLLKMTGFPTVVWDDRPIPREELPEAEKVFCGSYETALAHLGSVTCRDFAVVLTAGHQGDYQVLKQILRTPAGYIGCIGSRKKSEAMFQQLTKDGFSPADLRRVHAPIGLDIGGSTPEEIAVSIVAQMIAYRAGKPSRQ